MDQTANTFAPINATIWLKWLVNMRWFMVIVMFLWVMLGRHLLYRPELLYYILGVFVAQMVGNIHAIAMQKQKVPITSRNIFAQLLLDTLALTVVLMSTGGNASPFADYYLLLLVMASAMLSRRGLLSLAIVIVFLFFLVTAMHMPFDLREHENIVLNLRGVNLIGRLMVFLTSVMVIGTFVTGLTKLLSEREQSVSRALLTTSRTDRLRAVGSLAAGAAHEINTPLSTILMRLGRIGRRTDNKETSEDVSVAKNQLMRCKAIVERLLIGAGDPTAQSLEILAISTVIHETVKMWTKGKNVEVRVTDSSYGTLVQIPRIAFSQAFVNLLNNANQAHQLIESDHEILVTVTVGTRPYIQFGIENNHIIIDIRDFGIGLPADDNQVGEPFYTTKLGGTGLGVYVARAVAEGVGGGLSFVRESQGTTARWVFPAHE